IGRDSERRNRMYGLSLSLGRVHVGLPTCSAGKTLVAQLRATLALAGASILVAQSVAQEPDLRQRLAVAALNFPDEDIGRLAATAPPERLPLWMRTCSA